MKNTITTQDLCNYDFAEFENEEIRTKVIKRNKSYLKFLSKLVGTVFSEDITNIKLLRSPHRPAVVINNKLTVSMFVKNYKLHLLDKPKGGDIIYSIDFTKPLTNNIISRLKTYFKFTRLQPIYTLKMYDGSLYKSDNGKCLYTTETNPRLFFVKTKAEHYITHIKSVHNTNMELESAINFNFYADNSEFINQVQSFEQK